MGYVTTPKYILSYVTTTGKRETTLLPSHWKGRCPSKTSKGSEKLRECLKTFNNSMLNPDGCNRHIFKEYGVDALAVSLSLCHNYDHGKEIIMSIGVPIQDTLKDACNAYGYEVKKDLNGFEHERPRFMRDI